jgi:hypothetical protein
MPHINIDKIFLNLVVLFLTNVVDKTITITSLSNTKVNMLGFAKVI